MAMIKCSECGKDVSDTAKTCPSCGAKVRKPVSKFKAAVIVLMGVAAVYASVQSDRISEEARAQEDARRAAMSPEERQVEDRMQEMARRLAQARNLCEKAIPKFLNDPDSAKLEPSNQWRTDLRSVDNVIVYPAGRAKNAFGAYVHVNFYCNVKGLESGKPFTEVVTP